MGTRRTIGPLLHVLHELRRCSLREPGMGGVMRKRRTCLTHGECYDVGALDVEIGGEEQ